MRVSILIFQPSTRRFDELREQFQAAAPADWEVHAVPSAQRLLRRIEGDGAHHLVVLPDELGKSQSAAGLRSGLELIPAIRKAAADVPIVVVAEQGNVERAARAVEAGATDFLVLGERLGQRIATLLGKLRGLLEVIDRNCALNQHNAQLREAISTPWKIIGRSPPMRALLEQIARVAMVPRPVLIVGERGTGKELVARAIHLAAGSAPTQRLGSGKSMTVALSPIAPRKPRPGAEQKAALVPSPILGGKRPAPAFPRPMVTVNCAAFNDALLESELFGHEKGAFTGAEATRYGKFEQADGGTLFLDEIGNMSPPFQEKVLRVVEYGTFTRVGGSEELRTTARVIAATNRDLREQIRRGEFLADLYDRLTFETLVVPPLRERNSDVELLAQHFLDQFARETPAFAGKTLSPEAIAALKAYRYPGNVRELKNIIERAAYRDRGGDITPEDLGLPVHGELGELRGDFSARLDGFARRMIADALKQAAGNQAQAARSLGLNYHQFRYYLRKHLGNRDARSSEDGD